MTQQVGQYGMPVDQYNPYQNEVTLPDGSIFKEGKPYSTIHYPKGNERLRYDGEVSKGIPHGQGSIMYTNGNKYEGTIFNNTREGKGKLIFVDGTTYDGMWEKDKYNGIGTYVYEGKKYVGEFVDNYFNGQGILTWREGHTYNGKFENDKMHGEGKLVERFPSAYGVNTVTFDGTFNNGQKWTGREVSTGNVTYQCDYVNGVSNRDQCCVII